MEAMENTKSNIKTKVRKSSQFRTIYADGVRFASLPTEIRLLFTTMEPIEVDSEKEGFLAVEQAIHCQVEVVMNNQLAKWVKDMLDHYFKSKPEASS